MSNTISEQNAIRELGDFVSNEIILGQTTGNESYTGVLQPKRRLGDYMQVVFGLEPAPHHQIWIEKLEDDSNKRIAFICPPGHAKTTVAGVAYPSWKIGRMPERHFLYYGNTMTQARKQSVAIRDLTQTDVYQSVFPVERSPRGWAGDRWYLKRENVWDKDPTMIALGVDGPGLGARTDEIIFDDVADLENMNTEESREKVTNKILSVAFSRQSGASKGTRMIAVMTRWHEDDLAKLYEEQGFEIIWMPALGYWEIVTLAPLGVNCAENVDDGDGHHHPPQSLAEIEHLAEKHDLDDGEALWGAEYPKEYFDSFKKKPDIWTLEFQGLAKRPGGNAFTADQFRVWSNDPDAPEGTQHLDPNRVRGIFTFWDTASKKKKENDYWAGPTFAWCTDGYYMLELYSAKMEFPEGVRKMEELWRRRYQIEAHPELPNSALGEFAVRGLYIETTGQNNGEACVQSLVEKRVPATGITPTLSKEERAGKTQIYLDDRPVYFPLDPRRYIGSIEAPSGPQQITLSGVVAQFTSFPKGRKDDIVDAIGMALDHLTNLPINVGDEWRSRLSVNQLLERKLVRSAPVMVSRREGGVGRHIQKGYFSGRGPTRSRGA